MAKAKTKTTATKATGKTADKTTVHKLRVFDASFGSINFQKERVSIGIKLPRQGINLNDLSTLITNSQVKATLKLCPDLFDDDTPEITIISDIKGFNDRSTQIPFCLSCPINDVDQELLLKFRHTDGTIEIVRTGDIEKGTPGRPKRSL